jgi:hypothetical protein
MQRKSFSWNEIDFQEQKYRLRHAIENADIRIDTDNLTPDEILAIVLRFLEELPDQSSAVGHK